MTVVLRKLPQIKILDGGHIGLIDASSNLEAYIEKLKASPAASEPLPIEPWWTELDVENAEGEADSEVAR